MARERGFYPVTGLTWAQTHLIGVVSSQLSSAPMSEMQPMCQD